MRASLPPSVASLEAAVQKAHEASLLPNAPSTDEFLASPATESYGAGSIWVDPLVLELQLTASDLDVAHRCIEAMESSAGGHSLRSTQVFKGTYRGAPVAVKRFVGAGNTVGNATALATVCKTLCKLKHPNLVPLIGLTWTKELDLQVVTPWASGGDLRSLLDTTDAAALTWQDFKCQVAIDIVVGLSQFNRYTSGIGALTPRNVLLDAQSGAASLNLVQLPCVDIRDVRDRVPSPVRWVAPEVVLGGRSTPKSDVYSLGVIITELDTTKLPFHDAVSANGAPIEDMLIAFRVARRGMRPTLSPECPPGVVELVCKCFSEDPELRPSLGQLKYTLRNILKGEL